MKDILSIGLPIFLFVMIMVSTIIFIENDKLSYKLLHDKKPYTITGIYQSSNQFIINDAFVLRLMDNSLEKADENSLTIGNIILNHNGYENRVLVEFNNTEFGYVDCEILTYQPEKRRGNK